jgi:hypothetical protein
VGQYASVALEPGTERPFIGYRDSTDLALRLASRVGSGGNCGPGGSWRCEYPEFWKLVSNDDGVRDPIGISIAFRPDCGVHPSVAYAQGSNFGAGLVALIWSCSAQALPVGLIDVASGSTYHSPSLKFDDSSDAVLAYQKVDASVSTVRQARQNGTNLDPVDLISGFEVGQSTSAAAFGGLTLVAYTSSLSELSIAQQGFTPGLGDCGPSNMWFCKRIDGQTVALATASRDGSFSGKGHIAYIVPKLPGGSLKYATSVGSGGNCGGGEWNCSVIDDVGQDAVQSVAIAADPNDDPVIAYHDKNDGAGNGMLKVARPKVPGNCGPTLLIGGIMVHTWQCTTVDDGGGTKNVGRFASIVLDSKGLGAIAYYDASDGDLLFAREREPTPVPAGGPGLDSALAALLLVLCGTAGNPRSRRPTHEEDR